jgi:hypothetical protein
MYFPMGRHADSITSGERSVLLRSVFKERRPPDFGGLNFLIVAVAERWCPVAEIAGSALLAISCR